MDGDAEGNFDLFFVSPRGGARKTVRPTLFISFYPFHLFVRIIHALHGLDSDTDVHVDQRISPPPSALATSRWGLHADDTLGGGPFVHHAEVSVLQIVEVIDRSKNSPRSRKASQHHKLHNKTRHAGCIAPRVRYCVAHSTLSQLFENWIVRIRGFSREQKKRRCGIDRRDNEAEGLARPREEHGFLFLTYFSMMIPDDHTDQQDLLFSSRSTSTSTS